MKKLNLIKIVVFLSLLFSLTGCRLLFRGTYKTLPPSWFDEFYDTGIDFDDTEKSDGLIFSDPIDEWQITIESLENNTSSTIKIPTFYNSLFVTAIGENCFKDNTNLETIILPNSIRIIKRNAFSGCTNLKEIILPADLVVIEEGAFSGCTSLKRVRTFNNLNIIGDSAFKGCTSLEGINIKNYIEYIGDEAFKGCAKLKLEIGDRVEYIGYKAFDGIDDSSFTYENGFKYITGGGKEYYALLERDPNSDISLIHKDLTLIAEKAFEGYQKEFVFDTNNYLWLRYICDEAFRGSNIKSLIIDDDLFSIGEGAFSECHNLESVECNAEPLFDLSDNLFKDCENLREITFNNHIESIGKYTFSGCASLERISGAYEPFFRLEAIGEGAFEGCASLKEFDLHRLEEIPNYAFNGCVSLETIKNDEDRFDYLQSIGDYAFANCKKLKEYPVSYELSYLGKHAFENCESLEQIYISPSLYEIYEYTFHNCFSLTSINIPGSIINIGPRAFEDCTYVRELVIGSGVRGIEERAFSGLQLLDSLSLPSDIYDIDKSAFNVCYMLNSRYTDINGLRYLGTEENPTYYLMDVISLKDTYTIDSNCVCIAGNAFSSSKMKYLELPNNVKYIGTSAFNYSQDLEKLILTSNVEYIGESILSRCNKINEIQIPFIGPYKDYQMRIDYFFGISPMINNITSSLKRVIILEGCEVIPAQAFMNCKKIEYISIPSSVEYIEADAFKDCTSLVKVTIKKGVIEIEGNAFSGETSGIIVIEDETKPSLWSRDFNTSNAIVYWNNEDPTLEE